MSMELMNVSMETKSVKVRFVSREGQNLPRCTYLVASNNLPMGVARAQYRLWKDKGADRFSYRTESAMFVNQD